MKKNIDLLHDIDLEIVKTVVKICDENNLLYYMLGGTMLGAIRHKGFIPWDDDIDLGLPRKDYETFLRIAPNLLPSHYKLVNYKTDPNYHYYITRILDTNTKVIENRFASEGKYTSASIDIFPLDGSPNGNIARWYFCKKLLIHRAASSLHFKKVIDKRKRPFGEELLLKFIKLFPTDKMFDFYNQLAICDKMLKQYDMSESLYTGNCMGAYRDKELIPTEWYGVDSFYEFENIRLRGIKEYHKYLSQLYGDYMQLPPEDNRRIHFTIVEINGNKV